MGLSPQDAGLDLTGTDVGGRSGREVRQRGICICGHRVAKHRNGRCFGVPPGRTKTAPEVINNECLCREAVPVLLVSNARRFQLSWSSAEPDHPFTAALRLTPVSAIEEWLIDTPIMCASCTATQGVRAVYVPRTARRLSAFACYECAPTVGTGA